MSIREQDFTPQQDDKEYRDAVAAQAAEINRGSSTRIDPREDGEYRTLPSSEVPGYPVMPNEEQPRVLAENTFDPNKRSRKKFVYLGAGAAAAALAVGIAMGTTHSKGGEAPRPQPTASAGVAPGEVAPTPSVSETTVEANPNDPSTWTETNVPLTFEGKEVEGVTAFEDAVAVKIQDYPTPEEAFPVMIERVNQWMNYGNTVEQDTKSKGFISPDRQSSGIRAITDTFVDPAFERAIAGSGNEFTRFIQDVHREAVIEWKPENPDYKASISIEKTVNTNPIHATLVFTSTKLEQEGKEPQRILLHTTLVEGENGNWEMIGNTGYESLDN